MYTMRVTSRCLKLVPKHLDRPNELVVSRDSLISLSDAIEALLVQCLVEERPMISFQRRIWLDDSALTECLLVDVLVWVN